MESQLSDHIRIWLTSSNGSATAVETKSGPEVLFNNDTGRKGEVNSNAYRKTKIVCTIGPCSTSRKMIWKLAETGINVARLNMSQGDHAPHQKIVDLVKECNAQHEDKVIAVMLDTKGPEVRSGDVPHPILLKEGRNSISPLEEGSAH